jgi:hypothetical protein
VTEPDPSTNSARSSTSSVAAACVLLTGVVIVAFPVFGWFGYTRSGIDGLLAAAVAAVVCWLGAFIALVITGVLRGTPQAVSGILAATLFRMGVPLAAGLLLSSFGGPLAKAGVFGMVVGYYLLTLVVETLLSLRLIMPAPKAPKAS